MAWAELPAAWRAALGPVVDDTRAHALEAFVAAERGRTEVFPPEGEVFAALQAAPPEGVRVVVLGQDPYHGPGQAHGLAFSVRRGVKVPPSLRNIHAEVARDVGVSIPTHGDLSGWARQGVLLLNTVLTVRRGEAHSHRNKGWERLTDAVIDAVAQGERGVAFLLWGAAAQRRASALDATRHLVLQAPHPSPLSAYRGFHGCGHFSATNRWFEARGQAPIRWGALD